MAGEKKISKEEIDRQMAAIQRAVFAKKARDSLIDFQRYRLPDPENSDDPNASRYRVAPHHRMIAEALEKVARREIMRLAISVPPQFGKSELSSRGLPAWILGRIPYAKIILAAYNTTFAEQFGDEVRNIMISDEYKQVFPKTRLRTGSKAKGHMMTTYDGQLNFVGRDGRGSGLPADFFVIDDLFKSHEEARSLAAREAAWRFYVGIVEARTRGTTTQVMVGTRWSDDDLIGRLTDPKNPYYKENVAKQWTVINIPAILESPTFDDVADSFGLPRGGSLWEQDFPLHMLKIRQETDPTSFSAIYQGRPQPPEGTFFKRQNIHTYQSMKEFPKQVRYYLSGDLAISPERDRDKTCVGLWGLDEDGTLWLHPDLYWERKSSDDSVDRLLRYANDYEVLTYFGEKGQIEKSVGPFLAQKMRESGKYFHTELFPTARDKGGRATSIRGRMNQGKVMFPAFAPWWPEALNVMLNFTGDGNDTEDDFCDMVGLIGQGMEKQVRASGPRKSAKVVQIGTAAWVLQRSKQDEEFKRRAEARRGM